MGIIRRWRRVTDGPFWTYSMIAPALAIAFGTIERFAYLLSPASLVNSDEAITGLTAISVIKGEFPLIVGGNDYGGVTEAYVLALPVALMRAFKLVGGASLLLEGTNFGLHILMFWTLYRVLKRFVASSMALLLIVPLWLLSASNITLATQAYLGYISGVIAAVVSVGLMVEERVFQLTDQRSNQTIIAGLLAGFAFWQHPIVGTAPLAVLTVAGITHLIAFRWKALRVLATAALATFVGAIPFLWRLVHRWGELPTIDSGMPMSRSRRFELTFSEHLPRALGLRTLNGAWALQGMKIWVPGLLLVALIAAVIGAARKGHIAALGLLSIPFMMALTPATSWSGDGRYGFLITPPLLIAGAAALSGARTATMKQTTAAITVAGVLGFNVIAPIATGTEWRENDVLQVVSLLDSRHIEAVRGDYWIVYRIANVTSERIAGSDWDLKRIQRLERRVQRSQRVAYVLTSPAADYRVPNRERLERVEVAGNIIYLPPKAQ